MKKPAYVKTILHSELNCFFHNHKQILVFFLPGPLVVLLIMFFISHIATVPSQIEIYGGNNYKSIIQATIQNPDIVSYSDNKLISKADLSSHKNHIVIQANPDEINISYNSSLITDTSLISNAKDIARRIAIIQDGNMQISQYDDTMSTYHLIDISNYADQIQLVLIPFLSLMFIVFFMLTNNCICSLSVDTVSGNQERGTFDMLVLSGASVLSILVGKYLFVFILNLCIFIFGSIIIMTGLSFVQPALYTLIVSGAQSIFTLSFPFIICLCSVSILSPALFIALASFFTKSKQASAYASIVQIILSLFTYAPIIINSKILDYLPISNLWSVLHNSLVGKSVFAFVLSCLVISILIAATALFIAKNNLERETSR